MNSIEIAKLTKKYGDFTAVSDVEIKTNGGEIVGFVGKNGAGKSTTIRCLLNFLQKTNGKLSVLGVDSEKGDKKIRNSTGYMPSDASFPSGVSSRELFSLCLKFSGKSVEEMESLARYFELDLSKKISELSLGNRKKVSIISTLLKDATVLVLDEPTSGLDPLMQEKFFALLQEKKANGVSIFLSSHNLSEIEKYCDRVMIIKDGKIIDEIDLKNRTVAKVQVVQCTLANGEKQKFEYEGEVADLLLKLSQMEITELEIRYKTIEDEFIKYYLEDRS